MSDLLMLYQKQYHARVSCDTPLVLVFCNDQIVFFLFWFCAACLQCGCVGVILLTVWPGYICKEANCVFVWVCLSVCGVCLLSANWFSRTNCHIGQTQTD